MGKVLSRASGGNGFKSRRSKRGESRRESVLVDRKDRKKEKSDDGFSPKSLDDMFNAYADESKLVIGVDGIIQFCNDIGVTLEDPVMLVISWLMEAAEQGQYTKEEFIGAFRKERVDSIQKVQAKLPVWREFLNIDHESFKEIYQYSFFFSSSGKRQLEIEIAEELLVLLLGDNCHSAKFSEFLQQQKNYKVLNLDQWMGFLEFAKVIGSFDADFEGYDVQDPWPVILDEFVVWCRSDASRHPVLRSNISTVEVM